MIDCSEILIAFTVNPLNGIGGAFNLTVMAGKVIMNTFRETSFNLAIFMLINRQLYYKTALLEIPKNAHTPYH